MTAEQSTMSEIHAFIETLEPKQRDQVRSFTTLFRHVALLNPPACALAIAVLGAEMAADMPPAEG